MSSRFTKTEPNVWHVRPTRDGKYAVRRSGALRACRKTCTQAEAVSKARVLIRRLPIDGIVVIHRYDGTILEDRHYLAKKTPL